MDQEMLKLPESDFINTYRVAYDVVYSAVESHESYWSLIKEAQKHIQGKKPFPQEELNKKGMAWAYNFNYGKARAKIEKGTAESISKISSAISLGYTTFRNVTDEDKKDEVLRFLEDPNKRGIVSSIIGYSFVDMLMKETRLSGFLNEIEYPSYAFGYCPLVFDDKNDWAPKPIHPLDIAFRPNTKPHEIKQFVLFDKIPAQDLYEKWVKARNEKTEVDNDETGKKKIIATSGWNLPGLEKLLLRAFKGRISGNRTAETWEDVIPTYVDNPSYVITSTENVTIAKIYYVELDGTLTEVYIPWSNAWQMSEERTNFSKYNKEENDTGEIIFKKNHGKYDQVDWITIIRDSSFSETGSIQDMRGIAKYAVEDSIRYNRGRNALGNKLIFAGSPWFENPSTQVAEKFKVTVSQGFVMVPSAYPMLERQPSFDTQTHMLALSFEEREFTRDTQQFDASIQGRLTSRPNKDEVRRVSEEVGITESAKNNIKLRDYSAMLFTCLKRMPKIQPLSVDVKKGKERFYNTIKKNLGWLVKTDADIDKIIDAVDAYILDAVIKDVELITIAIQMSETPYARNRFRRMLLLARGMPIEEVNNAVPLINDKFINMQDDRIAAFENDMFWTTNEVVFSGIDDDIVHLEAHISKCNRVVEGVNNRAITPMAAAPYLANNLNHSLLHIDKLGSDPILNGRAQQYMEAIDNLNKIRKQIEEAAAKIVQEQQQANAQPVLDPETQAEIQRDDFKVQRTEERKDFVAQNRTQQRQAQIQLDHEIKLRKIELENQRKNVQETYNQLQ